MTDTPTQIKQRFFNSLKRGTGEAFLILQDNPTIDFSNFIIKGALKNYAYDGQSESSRGQYLYDIIKISKQQDKIRKAVLKGLATEHEDTWALTQLFDLTKIFAQQSDPEARQAIYDRFLNRPIEHSDWVGYSEILEIDGINGIVFIAEKFGKWIEQNPDDWQDNSIISHFQNDNPNIQVLQELENFAKTNKYIRIYLDNIKRTEQNRENHVREKQSFHGIIDEVVNSKPFLSFRRKKELTEIEINEIAKQLLIEKDKLKQERLIAIFDDYQFPFDSDFILGKAKQKTSSRNRVAEYAINALKLLKSDNIRQFALDRVSKVQRPQQYVDILISNYKNGDHTLLTDIAKKFHSEHIIEGLAGSYVEIYKANKTAKCKEPLEVLYSKINCGIHRNSIIEVLIDNNVLSDRIREEIRYDSYLETRELLA